MLRLLVPLVFVAPLLFSPVLSESQNLPIFSFVGFTGSNLILVSAEPGKVLAIDLSDRLISKICITAEPPDENCGEPDSGASLPDGTRLVSTNESVALVSQSSLDKSYSLSLLSSGSTFLQLRQGDKILKFYTLVVTILPPGLSCTSDQELQDADSGIRDCARQCVPKEKVEQKLNNSSCDDGDENNDDEDVDLSCPAFRYDNFACFNKEIADESCVAQFGDAPDFALCGASVATCSFNALTGGGTCAEMCRQFGSVCVAALSNPQEGGCNPNTLDMDPNAYTHTCDTGAMTEICVCERR